MNEETQREGLGFWRIRYDAARYPAKMWGSGRRAREVMPAAM
jgi:hypothetical protein